MSCKNPDCQCKTETATFEKSAWDSLRKEKKIELPKGFEKLTLLTGSGAFVTMTAKHRPDLHEKSPNWHYYETLNGKIQHFRKENMVCVLEDAVASGIEVRVTE